MYISREPLFCWLFLFSLALCTHIAPKSGYSLGDWSTKNCSAALTGNTGYSNLQMWTEADAAGTWDYISNLPYDENVSLIDWTSFVARNLNVSSWQDYQCQNLSDSSDCVHQQDCYFPLTPGGWMVINSIANIWNYHWTLFNLVQTARSQIDVDIVVNNFSPQFDEAAYIEHQLFLTSLTLGMTMAIGAIFNIGVEFATAAIDIAAAAAMAAKTATLEATFVDEGLSPLEAAAKAASQLKNVKKETLQSSARSSILMMSWQASGAATMYEIAHARYSNGIAENGLSAQNLLTDLISNTTDLWQTSEAGYISQLFNGSQSSMKSLGEAMDNGTWLTPWDAAAKKNNFTSASLPLLKKHLFGMMIPYAWAAATKSKQQIMPMIVMGDGCLTNVSDLVPKDSHYSIGFDSGVDDKKLCFQGKSFWLLTPYKSHKKIRYQAPPGLNMLTGTSTDFGGLMVQDIVISSYYAWGNNSYVNPAPKPDPSLMLEKEAWVQSVQYPGFFNYPICDGINGMLTAAQSFRDKEYVVPC